MNLTTLQFVLNGEETAIVVDTSDMLVDVLRERMLLTGTKKGCGKGECGACTVIMNGAAVNSCMIPALKAMGSVVETIEGIGTLEKLHPLQESFMDEGAIQCGFCTPGMIMSAKALLDSQPHPDGKQIREAIAGNICRCTGYVKIKKAILSASEKLKG